MSSAEIPNGMLGAHSGMTAEGDNRVLMQKVVKDIMADCQKDLHKTGEMTMCPENQIPKMKSIANQETLTNLIYYREIAEIEAMQNSMAQKVMQEKKKFFDVWMYEASDEIQDVAQAFGERYALENSLRYLKNCPNANAKIVLERVIFLSCIALVRKEQAWYLINGVISPEAASQLDAEFDAAVKAMAPFTNDCVEALGVPNIKELHGPIARDFVAFNA